MCLDLIHLTKKLFPAIEDNSLLNPPAHTGCRHPETQLEVKWCE